MVQSRRLQKKVAFCCFCLQACPEELDTTNREPFGEKLQSSYPSFLSTQQASKRHLHAFWDESRKFFDVHQYYRIIDTNGRRCPFGHRPKIPVRAFGQLWVITPTCLLLGLPCVHSITNTCCSKHASNYPGINCL